MRRDFTVNAMALRLPETVLVDPSGGVDDLLAGTLRTPSAPEISFGDDPLRMLRAARFTSQLGFTVDAETRAAMARAGATASRSSAPSASATSCRSCCAAPTPRRGHRAARRHRARATTCCPRCPALRLEIDEHHHHKDVYEHSLTVLDQAIELEQERHPGAEPDLVLRLAALLHDIGKPATRRIEPGGAVTFHHHDVVGAKLAAKRLRALRFDNDTIDAVARLIELHLRFFGYTEGAWTDSAVRRYVRDAGDAARATAHPHAGRRDDPQPAQGRPARVRLRRPRGAHRRARRSRRSSTRCAPTSTASRSWQLLGLTPGPRGRRGVPLPARAAARRGAARRGGGGATAARVVAARSRQSARSAEWRG